MPDHAVDVGFFSRVKRLIIAVVVVGFACAAPASAQANHIEFCDRSHPMVVELTVADKRGTDRYSCTLARAVSHTEMNRIHPCHGRGDDWYCRGRITDPRRFPRHVHVAGRGFRITWWRAKDPVYLYRHWIATARSGSTVVRWSIDDVGVLGDD